MTDEQPPFFKGTFEVTCSHKVTQQHIGVLGDLLQKYFVQFEFSQITHEGFIITVQVDNQATKANWGAAHLIDAILDRFVSFRSVRVTDGLAEPRNTTSL